MWRFYLIAVIFATQFLIIYSIENWPWSGMKDTHFERVMEGQDITLKCAGRVEDAPAHWDFKTCGGGFNRSLCSDVIKDELKITWQSLSHNNSTLVLNGVRPMEAGLYRCRQAATPLIYIYHTIQLEILTYHDEDDDLPKFLDDLPKNITVHKNSQAIFQCKVSSNEPVTIRWVWQGVTPGAVPHRVGDGEIGQAGGAEISKFSLAQAKPHHTGRYFCVALNTKGYTNSSAYLEVLGDEAYDWHESNNLYILFLLPVGLAIVPISLWLCFLCHRRRRNLSAQDDQSPNAKVPLKYSSYEEKISI